MVLKQEVAVIGASGFMGTSIFDTLKKDYSVVGTNFVHSSRGLVPLDIRLEKDVNKFMAKYSPETVIHLAALTDVDLCERDKALAFEINVTGTSHIAKACKALSSRLVYLSTDFVFDGKKGNYSEQDNTIPINIYGKTKLAGEELVKNVENHVIIRTSTPYSVNHKSKKFLSQLIEKLSTGKKIKAFSDFTRSPTLIENLAENIKAMLPKKYAGTMHLAGSSQLTMYDAALIAAEIFGFDPSLIEKAKSSSVPLDAPRPQDSSLDISVAKKFGLNIITYEDGLRAVKEGFKK